MIEEWREIDIFPGRKVSNLGRVWTPHWNGRILPLHYRRLPNGAKANVTFTTKINGAVKTKTVHRLVLEAFVGPCPDGMEGCHNNGDPWDNRLKNLRWDTHAANMADAIAHGTFRKPSGFKKGNTLGRGVKNIRAKITEDIALDIKRRLLGGQTCVDIVKAGIAPKDIVYKISAGKSWAWLQP